MTERNTAFSEEEIKALQLDLTMESGRRSDRDGKPLKQRREESQQAKLNEPVTIKATVDSLD